MLGNVDKNRHSSSYALRLRRTFPVDLLLSINDDLWPYYTRTVHWSLCAWIISIFDCVEHGRDEIWGLQSTRKTLHKRTPPLILTNQLFGPPGAVIPVPAVDRPFQLVPRILPGHIEQPPFVTSWDRRMPARSQQLMLLLFSLFGRISLIFYRDFDREWFI